ncbi:uncharacterized protein LOC127053658 [Gopherus flavomarginatus]|uniref:uncharacterized protein LOC127053658 n=1 Tax=Gopherus flavomarginatus TaxID=286002 RepID=UPI0021CBF011|nr:uncharacterized protein LOC127053658 [Gopherus flavomarginatus]
MDTLAEVENGAPKEESCEAELEGSGVTRPPQANPLEVWICGHTVVTSLWKRGWCHPYGARLGIDPIRARVSWLGTKDMLWDELLSLIQSVVQRGVLPDVIIIHLGENDLAHQSRLGLIKTMKNDLTTLCSMFPKTKIVWSTLLPRTWPVLDKPPGVVEKSRKIIIKELSKFCSMFGISVLRHDQIMYSSSELFSPNGVHLSEIGEGIFNASLREAIESCL